MPTFRISDQPLIFSDYLFYLRDVLKEDAKNGGKLIEHIYDRHSYYLIDEFQDTNPIQGEIFFYLTAKEPKENWQDCVPKPGSLFIVGDPKQSIYRFREADVSAFLKVKGLFTGEVGEVLYLQRNFRSTKPIREWFNRIFTGLMPTTTEEQSKFDEIPLDNVAATRARRALIIGYSVKASGEPSASNAWMPFLNYCDGDFFEKITKKNTAIINKAEAVDAELLYAEAEKEDILKSTTSKEQRYSIIRPSMIRLKSTISSEDDFEDSDDSETRANTVRKNAAIIGTMVHMF